MAVTTVQPGRHLADEGMGVPEDAVQRAGQAPPAESGVSALDAREPNRLTKGWVWTPLALIIFVVALFIAGTLARAISLMT
ncbi:DUF6480 family protein [Actinacidiphila yeochonensis]|uniref:DUF6480 family protein n=1 Tax=Actinacidiphila yeochonensis TaxID=89050 RepID=UPI000A49E5AD|nr:DUF6480 family protein [Actinacidiphila yeochonensis]